MRLEHLKNETGQLWLNVASSHYPADGFINLDNHVMMFVLDYPFFLPIIPSKNRDVLEAYREARKRGVFVRHDCRKQLPVPEGSVDHILCSHFLEHVFPDEAVNILTDFRRALKRAATMHIIVPDLEALARSYLEQRNRRCEHAADQFVQMSLLSTPSRGSWRFQVLEFMGGFGLGHRWMYDADSIRARIVDLGFDILDINDTPSRDFRHGDGSIHVVARKP